ncbi:MAG: hypothetical protein JWL71_1566 [Acidobacteria bacterium]|nr:hypothetical protein [Acidobacteriota bacterium]
MCRSGYRPRPGPPVGAGDLRPFGHPVHPSAIPRNAFGVIHYTAGEIDVIRKSSIFIAGTSAVPGLS